MPWAKQFESPIKLHYSQTGEIKAVCTHWFESPIKLHYSQTSQDTFKSTVKFESPIKLHYSQTDLSFTESSLQFESPIKLHYSQTLDGVDKMVRLFESPIKLHYSQTSNLISPQKVMHLLLKSEIRGEDSNYSAYSIIHQSSSKIKRFSHLFLEYSLFSNMITEKSCKTIDSKNDSTSRTFR